MTRASLAIVLVDDRQQGGSLHVLHMNRAHLVARRNKRSHRQYKHPSKRGRVTVPGKLSEDLAPGTLNSILKQAGLKETH
jgi:predicted RNA binding protein YcfA (HicA-like mRNA interferase family)